MRQNLRNAFLIGLLGGSLMWSANCSSATPQASVEPDCERLFRPQVTSGKNCKEIELPVLVHCVHPSYPSKVRRDKLEGKVVAEAVLTADGNLEGIKIVSSPAPELSILALGAFREWRYKPAFCRDFGKHIQVNITMTATFGLGRAKR